MFERAFQWTIAKGTRFLFALALALMIFTLATSSWNYYRSDMTGAELALSLLSGVTSALSIGAIPLTAAIVIESLRK